MNKTYLFFTFFVLGFAGLYFGLKNWSADEFTSSKMEFSYRAGDQHGDSIQVEVYIENNSTSYKAQLHSVQLSKTFSRAISKRQFLEIEQLCRSQIALAPSDSLNANIQMEGLSGERYFFRMKSEGEFEAYFDFMFRLESKKK